MMIRAMCYTKGALRAWLHGAGAGAATQLAGELQAPACPSRLTWCKLAVCEQLSAFPRGASAFLPASSAARSPAADRALAAAWSWVRRTQPGAQGRLARQAAGRRSGASQVPSESSVPDPSCSSVTQASKLVKPPVDLSSLPPKLKAGKRVGTLAGTPDGEHLKARGTDMQGAWWPPACCVRLCMHGVSGCTGG